MGGFSTEHDVSVSSGVSVVRGADSERYRLHPVLIQRDGTWIWSCRPLSPAEKDNFTARYFDSIRGPSARRVRAPALSALPRCDIAFLALHGKWGEDGHIQTLLEHWGLPYTGSGVLASALAMDKLRAKDVYRANGIPTPPQRVLHRDTFHPRHIREAAEELGLPLVIKDPTGGSSLELGIAKSLSQATKLASALFQKTERLMCETYIAGQEASCGYIEGQPPLPPTELRMTTREYFDYAAKYQGECREVTPAEFGKRCTARIQKLAKAAHTALGCSGYSRTDVRIDAAGNPWVLETNTLPGMTPHSLLPAQAACIGLSYSQLIDAIIQASLRLER